MVVVNSHSDMSFSAQIITKILLVRMEVVRMKEILCAYVRCDYLVYLCCNLVICVVILHGGEMSAQHGDDWHTTRKGATVNTTCVVVMTYTTTRMLGITAHYLYDSYIYTHFPNYYTLIHIRPNNLSVAALTEFT